MKIQLLILSIAVTSLVTACSHKPTPPPASPPPPPMAEGVTPPPPHEHGPGHDHDHPHAFPQEAVEACSGKKLKEKCNFQTPRNDVIRGTCKMTHGPEEVLGCHPNPPKKRK